MNPVRSILQHIIQYFDNDHKTKFIDCADHSVDWTRVVPFVFLHLVCFAVIYVGWSPIAIGVAFFSYFIRMFAITGFFHRYFSHKSFKTSRIVQFIFAAIGTAATQRGPLWWAAHHRGHHRNSDTEADPHSMHKGFWYSHCGWFMSGAHFITPDHLIKDFAQYPELVWLDRYDMAVALAYATAMFGLGELIGWLVPSSATNGWQMLIWGYFIATVVQIHATLCINSLAHLWGSRRYNTQDSSVNNPLLALITLGEGWHNNHHHYPGSTRQGFFWWELDITYLILKAMSYVGLVSDLKPVPERKLYAHKKSTHL